MRRQSKIILRSSFVVFVLTACQTYPGKTRKDESVAPSGDSKGVSKGPIQRIFGTWLYYDNLPAASNSTRKDDGELKIGKRDGGYFAADEMLFAQYVLYTFATDTAVTPNRLTRT